MVFIRCIKNKIQTASFLIKQKYTYYQKKKKIRVVFVLVLQIIKINREVYKFDK